MTIHCIRHQYMSSYKRWFDSILVDRWCGLVWLWVIPVAHIEWHDLSTMVTIGQDSTVRSESVRFGIPCDMCIHLCARAVDEGYIFWLATAPPERERNTAILLCFGAEFTSHCYVYPIPPLTFWAHHSTLVTPVRDMIPLHTAGRFVVYNCVCARRRLWCIHCWYVYITW